MRLAEKLDWKRLNLEKCSCVYVFIGCSVRSGSQSSAIFGKDMQESTVSEGTVETMMTMSPSEPHLDPLCKHLLAHNFTCTQVTNPPATIPTLTTVSLIVCILSTPCWGLPPTEV
jgi:hypothetical protein